MAKIHWMAAAVAALTLGACEGDSGTTPDLICPTALSVDAGGAWWVTNSMFGADVEAITLNATFRLADLGASAVFSTNPAETYQLWSTPDVLVMPVSVLTSPAGLTANPGAQFSYRLLVNVSTLPPSQTGLGFRPQSTNFGNLGPGRAVLLESSFTCQ
jgi:hypothetical protein